jgi:two-component system sensor kinase FixL
VEFERALYYKSTGERQVHGLYVPHFGEAGKVLGYFTFIQDITERVQAEEEKRKHGAQLAHMDRVTILAELSASLAHELNQPLTAIMANAQAAQRFLSWEPPELEEVAGALADIVADDMRAGEVIRRVRDLLKNGEPRSEFLQLNVVVEEVARLVKNDALKNRISVQMDLAPDLPAVRGDRIQMQQVLLNLVLNAFDAISSGTSGPREVAIQTSTGEDNSVVVAVRDSGVGASGKTLKHMFQPFFTTKQDGLGMGLAISKSIIENHGGRVWLKRNADRGITVCLALPAVPGSADDDD